MVKVLANKGGLRTAVNRAFHKAVWRKRLRHRIRHNVAITGARQRVQLIEGLG